MAYEMDYKKALKVVDAAASMGKLKDYPFDNPNIFPDKLVPKGVKPGSLEHSIFLFHSCSIDAMRSAIQVYSAMRKIAGDVRLDRICCYSRDTLKELFSKYLENNEGVNPPSKILEYNSMKLHMEYSDDPRKINKGTIDDTLAELQKFMHIGPGIAALIMKNFVRFGIWDFSPYDIPIKVDRHIIRISLGAGVVKLPESTTVVRADRVNKGMGSIYREVTSKEKFSAIDSDDTLWGTGSNLCSKRDLFYCQTFCSINCSIRPESDRHATWFYPKKETRKLSGVLPLKLKK